MNQHQQLVSNIMQGTETTTVVKAMLQRQGITKPQPTKYTGDPAKFPIFKKRINAWLNEREFDETEKIKRLAYYFRRLC